VIAINKKWHNTIFSLRGNHQLKPQSTSIYLGVAQGFRAPNLSDLTRLDSARSNEFEIPSLQLKPEYYLSVDSGIKFRSHKLNYDISIFYTDISDQIQRVPTGITNSDGEFEITKENIGNGYTYGSEIDIQYFLNKQLKLTARMAYIKGKIDTFPRSDNILENDYISRLMPTNLNLAIDYSAESGEWWLNTSMTAFDKADRLSARDKLDTQRIPPKGTPGFIIWNISGGYTISKATQLTVNLHNMLDKNYRIHGSGQNEAGRNLVVSIEYLF
jgi:hemoglobin/transferrin/lactoferrin receptor protein